MNISLDNQRPTTEAMRHAMVASQLRTNAVSDQRVLVAMNTLPREAFVPADVRDIAYRDTALPVAGGRAINLPMVTGRLLTEAYLERKDRVLLIGAAGGYTAAILAQIAAEVVAVEEDAALVALARGALGATPNVTLVDGPLAAGHPGGAPYDVLIVDGAIEHVPDALVHQVRAGGRVVAGLVERGVTRLASGRKTDGGFGLSPFMDSDCVVLPGFATPQGFRF
ncbi:protein-L-isoaspartate O-methyltransferase [Sphingomonas sp. A2-49]|uniref:protein-L-isoaspartate O-methyltransferase family protein n=1 Tax=Sphingomonas sp. A2-49 TaxID=1391375 RepID=UPI0021D2E574|nr:protein-L-isoaspartate O-methyltransferase [Sphingomonas sp. A2-49]MCU6452861.1 protein-L-isoaspartate O-methyltransferase [Sphingomonas sp. A2-49]